MGRWNFEGAICGIDDALVRHERMHLPCCYRLKVAIAHYVAHGKVSNAAGGQETLLHDLVIICKDFRAACQVIEAIVQSGDVLDLLAEFAGIDTCLLYTSPSPRDS